MTLKAFLSEWQLRGSFLVSLALQLLQILPGNLRKRNPRNWVTVLLWVFYLLADKVAIFSISIASRTITDPLLNINPELLCFWTPILLLYLGGPDTITAFSLEDNQLWLRHGLTLSSQLVFVVYILARSWLSSGIRLVLLFGTVCMLVPGTLKYAERTWALYRASMGGLRKSMMNKGNPGPNYVDIVDSFSSRQNAGIPAHLKTEQHGSSSRSSSSTTVVKEDSNMTPAHLNTEQHSSYSSSTTVGELELLNSAYDFYETLIKRLIVGLIVSYEVRDKSRSMFREKQASEAYKMVGIELNFAYDAMYTKALVAHSPPGRMIRATNIILVPAACLLFVFIDKHHFRAADVLITYLLLAGALALEILSLVVFIISDWTLVLLRRLFQKNESSSLNRKKEKWKWLEEPIFLILKRVRPPKKPRWSHSMKQHSLLSFCLQDQKTKFAKCLVFIKAKELFDKYWFTQLEDVPEELEKIIWDSLIAKSQTSESTDVYKSLRGEMAIHSAGCSELKWSIEGEFDESLLLWHVATDICYCKVQSTNNFDREASKLISRYMLYLLIVCPITLSSTAVIGLIRYRDTCAELIQFFNEEGLVGDESLKVHKMLCCRSRYCIEPKVTKESNACENLLFMHTDVPPKKVKGDQCKSVLWDAVELAKQLIELKEEKMRETIRSVWVEMLCFAARNGRGDYHAKLLSMGGELLTFVWILEAHLGLGDYFEKSGNVTTKVVLET